MPDTALQSGGPLQSAGRLQSGMLHSKCDDHAAILAHLASGIHLYARCQQQRLHHLYAPVLRSHVQRGAVGLHTRQSAQR